MCNENVGFGFKSTSFVFTFEHNIISQRTSAVRKTRSFTDYKIESSDGQYSNEFWETELWIVICFRPAHNPYLNNLTNFSEKKNFHSVSTPTTPSMTGIRGVLYCAVDRFSEIHRSLFKLDCFRAFAPHLFAENSFDELFTCPAAFRFDINRNRFTHAQSSLKAIT